MSKAAPALLVLLIFGAIIAAGVGLFRQDNDIKHRLRDYDRLAGIVLATDASYPSVWFPTSPLIPREAKELMNTLGVRAIVRGPSPILHVEGRGRYHLYLGRGERPRGRTVAESRLGGMWILMGP